MIRKKPSKITPLSFRTDNPKTAEAAGKSPARNSLAPGLYVVATPIGNAQDISLRALRVLGLVDAVLAEDTRVTAKLLMLHGIRQSLLSYNEHNAARERPRIIARLQGGASLALVSDAGTPLVSDPGYKLVRETWQAGIPVFSVPGASALLAALNVAGIPTNRFLFAGFLPPKRGERRSTLEELAGVPASLVFFESAQRLKDSLVDMAAILGAREAALARELTKLHEEVKQGTLVELAKFYSEASTQKGEITIVVGPPQEEQRSAASAEKLLALALPFMPVKEAAQLVSEASGLSRRQVYALALKIKERTGGA